MWEGIIARMHSDGVSQSLSMHSENVAEISNDISHYPNTSKLLAYLHDLGKLSTDFQNYIRNGGERGSVPHAWQGAFLINELIADDCTSSILLKEIVGFCITAHHNHLSNGVNPDGTNEYFNKYLNKNDRKYSFEDIKGKITKQEQAVLQALFDNAKPEIDSLLTKVNKVYKDRDSAKFALGLFVKYLFSCLVDADRLDAYFSGAVYLCEKSRKKFLSSWQNRKKEEIMHPFLKEKVEWGLVPYCQALMLVRTIRGDLDNYPPFLWK